jgi:signal transduction histidine kinase
VGDASLLRSALLNLIENAWKFTRRQPQPRIEFGSALDGNTPVFFVRDNGAGFDPAMADRLFLPFQRLHPASEFEGTGVGLATAERIIRRHGGRIWAQGEPGRGATFHFTLQGEN